MVILCLHVEDVRDDAALGVTGIKERATPPLYRVREIDRTFRNPGFSVLKLPQGDSVAKASRLLRRASHPWRFEVGLCGRRSPVDGYEAYADMRAALQACSSRSGARLTGDS
jgi:hypothetical protein